MLLVGAAVVFAVVYRQTGAQLTAQIDREIKASSADLADTLKSLDPRTRREVAAVARAYIDSQGYSPSSPILFAAVPGQKTVSNHLELFGENTPESGETPAEQALENQEGRALLATRLGYSVRQLPDAGDVRLYAQNVQLAGVRVLVGVGEPLGLVERAQHSVAETFVMAGAVALMIALVASYLAGSRVSAPLRRMAAVAARVDAGDLAPRMRSDESRADEVQVLADAFNHMLDRLAEAFAAQRAFIADASHELRTPLTVIRGQLEVLAAHEQPDANEVRRVEILVGAEISRITRLVDDLLLLAQAERADFLRVEPVALEPFVTDLWDGLIYTADRRFELGPIPAGTLWADPDRLAQALRNLVRNAIAHTEPHTGLVRLEIEPAAGDLLRFTVIDDGPGIPPAERERVFERFHRLDASRSRQYGGAGLGLAIVRAITEAHGGRVIALGRGDQQGVRMDLVLPGYVPALPE